MMVSLLHYVIISLVLCTMTCNGAAKLGVPEHSVAQALIFMSKERLDVQRKHYQRILRNQAWRKRLLYVSTGAAVAGAGILLIQWLQSQQAPVKNNAIVDSSQPKTSAKKAKARAFRSGMDLYEDELERRRYKRTWWGSIDTGVRQGLGFAFASFITGFVLNHMEFFSLAFKEQFKEWFQDMDVNEYYSLQSLTKTQCKLFGNSLLESMQQNSNQSTDSPEWDELYVDRIAYVSGDVMVDHAAWVCMIEKLFAFVLEALQAQGLEEYKMAAFEKSVYQCMHSINILTQHLETVMDDDGTAINKDQSTMMMVLLKKICRDVFYIAHTAGTVLYDQPSNA